MFGVPIAVEVDVLCGRKTSVSDVAETTLPACAWSPKTGESIRTRDPAAIGQLPLGALCAALSVGTISAAVNNVRMKRMSPPFLRGRRMSVATNTLKPKPEEEKR
jgi:hypothetical protein